MGYADQNARERPILGSGARVVWIGLALSYLFMLRASELFAGENGEFHSIYFCGGGMWRFSGITSSWG